MDVLIGLAILLIVVVLIGHGIWSLVARLCGFRIRYVRPGSIPGTGRLGRGEAPVEPGPRLGGSLALPPQTRGASHDMTAQLAAEAGRLAQHGLIRQETYADLMQAILGRPTVAPSVPVPVIPVEPPLAALADAMPARPVPPPLPAAPVVVAPRPVAQPLPPPAPAPVPVRRPRRPLSDVLAGFMEENNIRWGELVGGLLIVGCSVALVVSFWAEIAERPFLKFGVFTAVTVALFGVGLYSEHRWKLPTTSRGILLIATLLVPVNVLAFAAFSGPSTAIGTGPAAPGPAAVVAELVALGLFLWLTLLAAKVIAPPWPAALTAGVIGLSASVMGVRFLEAPARGEIRHLLAVGLAPLAWYGLATAFVLARAARWKRIRTRGANAVFVTLGVMSFSTGLALAFLVTRSTDPHRAVRSLGPLLSLAGLPALAAGLLVWRRTFARAAYTVQRTVGAAVAVAGALLMLAGIGLAWPDPGGMVPAAACDTAVLIAIAVCFEIPAAYVLAGPCLLVAWLLAFHVAWRGTGHVGWASTPEVTTNALLAPSGAAGLLPLTALLAGGAWALRRRGRAADGYASLLFAAVSAVIGIALVTAGGFLRPGDPAGAAWIYAIYAATALAVSWKSGSVPAGRAGWGLLLAACVQGVTTRRGLADPWPLALLGFASIAALSAVAARRPGMTGHDAVVHPARGLSLLASFVAAAIALAATSYADANRTAAYLLWAAATWGGFAFATASAPLLALAELGLCAAMSFAVIGRLARHDWFLTSGHPLLEPWTIQAEGIALGAMALLGPLIRRGLRRLRAWPPALAEDWRTDVWGRLLLAVTTLLLALAGWGILPGVARELASWPAGDPGPGASARAAQWGSWVLLAILLVTATATLRLGLRIAVGLILTIGWAGCLLWAARWAPAAASASALRWALVPYLLLPSAATWVQRGLAHDRIARDQMDALGRQVRAMLWLLAVLPILGLTLVPTSAALGGAPLVGPDARCWFARVSPAVSYAIPLCAVAAAFLGNAIREGSAAYALSGSLILNLAASVAYVWTSKRAGEPLEALGVLRLIQLNVIAAAGFALLWMALHRAGAARRAVAMLLLPRPLRAQVVLTLLASALPILAAAPVLFFDPDGVGPGWASAVGGGWGWTSILLAAAAAVWVWPPRQGRAAMALAGLSASLLGVMIGLTASRWDVPFPWASFHAFMIAEATAAWGMLGLAFLTARQARTSLALPVGDAEAPPAASPAGPVALQYATHVSGEIEPEVVLPPLAGRAVAASVRWSFGIGLFLVLLALRAMVNDPDRPLYSVGATMLVSILAATIACWRVRPGYLYGAGVLLNLAATMWFLQSRWGRGASLADFVALNASVLGCAGLAAFFLDRQRFAHGGAEGGFAFHLAAAVGARAAVLFVAYGNHAAALAGGAPAAADPGLAWAAVLAAAALSAALLWDERAKYAAGGLYLVGLAGVATALSGLRPDAERLVWASGVGLAAYSLGVALLWHQRHAVTAALRRLAPLPPRGGGMPRWLAPATSLSAALVVAIAAWSDLTFAAPHVRLLAAVAALSQGFAMALLTTRDRPSILRHQAVLAWAFALICGAWAWVRPGAAPLLDVATAALAALTIATILDALAAARLPAASPWSAVARRMTPALAGMAAAALLFILAAEVYFRVTVDAVPIRTASVIVVAGFVLAGCLAVTLAAVRGEAIGLSRRTRSGCVYAAEALLAVSFVHLRVTEPQLFGGVFQRFWPLIVMGIAFAIAAAGELLERRGKKALADPLHRTGVSLPLLAVLGFWAARSAVGYAELLLVVGAFYGTLALVRRSFAFALAAVLAANGALWYTLHHRPGFGFLEHPQLWLIPIALCILAAAQLNREQLGVERLRATRYLCLTIVYASSTADVFLNGVARAPWLPPILALLSVAGVLAGILLRIRSFLFLGTTFLTLAILTMIWSAQQNLHWTWLWYVAGILLGLGIIVTFALFEKKRDQMLAMVEGIKGWE